MSKQRRKKQQKLHPGLMVVRDRIGLPKVMSKAKAHGVCRDCGRKEYVGPSGWGASSMPRCSACGGALDRQSDLRRMQQS